MGEYDFKERLAFSLKSNGRRFEQMILDVIPGVVDVEKTTYELDRSGIDYIAHLRRGAEVFIDLKLRDKGCSKFWRNGEELALETWSVMPENGSLGKVGWTLDEAKRTHYTLHAFDPSDSDSVFILPFQLLRKAFLAKRTKWESLYRKAPQQSATWKSECIFIPATVVLAAINEAMNHKSPCDPMEMERQAVFRFIANS